MDVKEQSLMQQACAQDRDHVQCNSDTSSCSAPLSSPYFSLNSDNLDEFLPDSIRELNSQVQDLQQQLSEAKSDINELKELTHRHQAVLNHDQDIDLQELEKLLEVCNASFMNLLDAERRRVKQAREMCFYLQNHLCQQSVEMHCCPRCNFVFMDDSSSENSASVELQESLEEIETDADTSEETEDSSQGYDNLLESPKSLDSGIDEILTLFKGASGSGGERSHSV